MPQVPGFTAADVLEVAKTLFGEVNEFAGVTAEDQGLMSRLIAVSIVTRLNKVGFPVDMGGMSLTHIVEDSPAGVYEYATQDPAHPNFATNDAKSVADIDFHSYYIQALTVARVGGVTADFDPDNTGITHFHDTEVAVPGAFAGYTFVTSAGRLAFYAAP